MDIRDSFLLPRKRRKSWLLRAGARGWPFPLCRGSSWRRWAEAPIKIARMTLTIKLDGNWSSFQLANNTPPLSVTGSVIAPSARIRHAGGAERPQQSLINSNVLNSFQVPCWDHGQSCNAAYREGRQRTRDLALGARSSPKNS